MEKKQSQPKKARKKIIPTPEDFWSRYLAYKKHTKDNPLLVHDFVGKDGDSVYKKKERPLTIEGFECWLYDHYGIEAVQQYLENREGRYEAYVSIVARVRRDIRQDQIEGGMAGIYHHNLTARINGISDKVDSEVKQSVKILNNDPFI